MRRALILIALAACQLPRPADVPDVDAMPPTFAIGGRVSSMWPGASVELRLDVSGEVETLVVDHNGEFRFQRINSADTSFAVTVSTPPAGHDCTVANGVGRVDSADVVDIVVDCRAVLDIRLSAATPWVFDPASFDASVPLSVIAQATSVTVDAPKASAITIDGSLTASGAPSPVFDLPKGTSTITIAVTNSGITQTYSLALDRGAEPIRQYAYVKATNTDPLDAFGTSIAVSGNWLAVGAPGEDSDATTTDGDQTNNRAIDRGAVYLFERSGTTWTLRHYVKASVPNATGFGTSLAFTADHLAVGTRSGHVFVYSFDQGALVQEAIVTGANTGGADGFGTAVALRGSFLVVGAPNDDSGATSVNGDDTDRSSTHNGAAYVFHEAQPGTWTKDAYLKPFIAQAGQHFGASVYTLDDGSEQVALVGAPFFDSSASTVDAGGVFSFFHYATGWESRSYGEACCENGIAGATFGGALAANSAATIILAGTAGEGAATTGVASLGGVIPGSSGAFDVFANIMPPAAMVTRRFGSSLADEGHLAAVAAPDDPGSGFGVDPPMDVLRPDSGAVYLLEFTGSLQPAQLAYIKATNSRHNLGFGTSLAMSSDTLAIGTPFEESAATGVNGDELDVSLPGAGAVYVWH